MRNARRLFGAGVAALLVSGAAFAGTLPEARWLAEGADAARALTETPGECLESVDDPHTEQLAEIGRAAFRSPLLLGGGAARGGLSCNSCHVDGHSNPDFHFEGLSGEPGTADVSSSILSKVRDDGAFNPLPIPTLVGVAGKSSFGTAAPQPTLRAFIASAIVEEFQGEPTPPAILDGLVAYIGRMSAAACPSGPARTTARGAMSDVRRSLAAAARARAAGDRASADFLLASARAALGEVHDRFPRSEDRERRQALVDLSRDIEALRSRSSDAAFAGDLAAIDDRASRLSRRLHRARRGSLYDAEALAEFLGRKKAD